MIVVGGEALIDLIAGSDGRLSPMPGGGPYNTARTIARLGGEVSFLGRLSSDRFGRLLSARLEADGVGTRLIVDTAYPTTLVLAEIDAQGVAHYSFYLVGTSVPGLNVADARRAVDEVPDALHVGTLGLTLEPMADALAQLVAEVPAETLVMVDPNCRPAAVPAPARYRERLMAVLHRADIVKVSAEDLDYLALAASYPAAARVLVAAGASVVLLTRGDRAVELYTEAGRWEVPVPRVTVVDTVGAGDAFGGGFLMRWLEQGLGRAQLRDADRLADAAAFAVRVAAITCGRAGAYPPTRAELL